ncbi:MAG: cyclic nucleotide-binding domain-containing protein [Verrucomicrobiota bacterium]
MPDVKKVSKGDVLFNKGESYDGVYIVVYGLVSIYETVSGEDIEFAQVGKGGMFGEMATIDLGDRSASVRALTDCKLIHLSSKEYLNRLQSLPLWSLLLIQLLVRRLRHQNAAYVALKKKFGETSRDEAQLISAAKDDVVNLVHEDQIDADRMLADLGEENKEDKK